MILQRSEMQMRYAIYQSRMALGYLLAKEGGVCGKFSVTKCLEIGSNAKVTEDIIA